MSFCLYKVTINSSSHNFPIEMRLEWRLRKISECFAWLDNVFSGIWAWCVDDIVDELEIFLLLVFSDGSLVWTIILRESR